MVRFPCESQGSVYLSLTPGEGELRLEVGPWDAGQSTAFQEGLRGCLEVSRGGRRWTLARGERGVRLPTGEGDFEVGLGGGVSLGRLRVLASGAVEAESWSPLSPLEARFLARHGRPHPTPSEPPPTWSPASDLHAHFAGCPRPEALLAVGASLGLRYPAAMLASIGVHEGDGDPALSELSDSARERLVSRLGLPLDRQVPFSALQDIYRLRGPITKAPAAFGPLCWQIARDYRAMGVRWAELSFSSSVEAARLEVLRRELPAIEASTGVRLRFLAAMGRRDDFEWDMDYMARIEALAACPWVVGLDFLGQEDGSTRVIEPWIRAAADWAHRARPGFVIRVHAGENPAHPENIRVALEAARGRDVQLRIGHGLYGADDRTVALMREMGVVVEFNLNSNFALNNIQRCRALPLRRYLEEGVAVVLGTDGYGIYGTEGADEARAAWLAGLVEPEAMAALARIEDEVIEARRRADAPREANADAWVIPPDAPPVHYTPEVMARGRARVQVRDAALKGWLAALGVPVWRPEEASAWLQGRRCVCFAGAWRHSWAQLPPEARLRIEEATATLLEGLDPARDVLVTGGTRHGVEAVVQRHGRRLGFEVLGWLAWEVAPTDIDPRGATRAVIEGARLYDKGAGLYRLMREHDAWCVFMGGGHIVADEIQAAENLGLRCLLLDGVPGASALHARLQPQRAFRTGGEALRAILGRGAKVGGLTPLRHPGDNPCVDAILLRHDRRDYALEVLLIQRQPRSEAEPGRWALPGGFIATQAAPGELWRPDVETPLEACLRHLRRDVGILIDPGLLQPIGQYRGGGRDPRDSAERQVHTAAFAALLPEPVAQAPLVAGHDADDVRWVQVDRLPWNMGFDHPRLIRDALAALGLVGSVGEIVM